MSAMPACPNKGRLRPSVWGVSVAVLAVVMAVALVEVYLDDYTHDRLRAQILLSSIEEDAAEQALSEFEAIKEGEVTPEVAEGVAENRRELTEAFDELGRLNPGDEGLARVGEALGAYEAAVDEERVDPGFEALHEVVEDVGTRYETEARRADLIVDAATYGTALLAAAMLAVVAWLWQREQARRSEQEAIRRSEERFRSLAQNSSDVVMVVDADRNVLYQSPSMEKVLGHDPQGRIGKNVAEQSIVHPDDAAEQDAAFARAVANPGEGVVAEVRVRHRDGSWRYMEAIYTSLLDDPRVGGVVLNARDVTERRRAEEELRRSEERLRSVVESAADAFFVYDLDGRFVDVNRRACESLGYAREELLGLSVTDIEANFRPAALDEVWERAEFDDPVTIDGQHQRKDGTTFPVEIRLGVFEASGRRLVLALARDVTERKRAEEDLRRSERFLAEAQRIARVGSWEYEANVGEARWSDELYRILGLAPGQCASPTRETFMGFVHPEDRPLVERSGRAASDRRGRSSVEFRVVRADGRVRVVQNHHEVVFDGEEAARPSRVTGTVQDITERKALEERLEHQALHDPLTGLPNRALFSDRLEHALLKRAGRRGSGSVAVLFMDLDNFKYVNDSLTHEAGDGLLVRVAERLKSCVGPGDTVARFGGDEFTVLLEDAGPGEAGALAERIAEELKAPFDLDGREVSVTFSIGIALGGTDRERPADLLRKADLAMYGAKAEGKNTHKTFEAGMGARVAERLRLENALRRAVELGGEEFVVHYQPQVELATGAVVGFEALVRWDHPQRGTIPPAQFVPLAEETGLIVPLGRWVLEEACRQAKRWHDERPQDPPTKIGVNLSAREFQRPDLAEAVAEVLGETGLAPRGLDLEITESLAMEDTNRTVDALQALKDLGVGLSIDDFGTGHSSLSYLRRFPVDNLKMDKSFVDDLGHGREDTALVSTTIGLAHAFALKVVAEGVETAEQLERLRDLGCDLAQGYHFSKPLPSGAASALLAAEPGSAPDGGGANPTL